MTGFITSGELLSTPGYAVREYAWVPTVQGEGVLTIRLRRTAGGKEEADVYMVQRQVPPEEGVSEFLLMNATDGEQDDVYRVQLGSRGDTCTCKAAKCRLACKHTAAMSAILDTGD